MVCVVAKNVTEEKSRLNSTNVNRAYYRDRVVSRKKPLPVVFNIREGKHPLQLAGQTVKPFPRRKSAPRSLSAL